MSAVAGLVSEPVAIAERTDSMLSRTVPLVMRLVEAQEWDRVVSGFDGVCQEQLFSFASTRWPGVALEPRLFEADGKVVGGALMMIQSLPLGIAKIAISKWAPMLTDFRNPDRVGHYDSMIDQLLAEYADRRGMLVSILPPASVESVNAEYVALRERGFQRGAALPYPDRYLVRLRLSPDEQRKSFGQAWRRQLNKAEKSNLQFEHGGRDRICDFKQLYSAMTDRKQFPDHSAYETLDKLMALDDPLRPELFFVRHEGELVAGALIFKAGDRAVYLYGATNDKALPLRAGYFLHWHIIGWLRENTLASWYDLGGTDGYSGLHQFKKGMVGEAGVIRPIPPVVNYASHARARWLGTGALSLREAVNNLRRFVASKRPSGAKPDMDRAKLESCFK